MPKDFAEKIIDQPYDSSLRRGASASSSVASGSVGGTTYTPGTAIDISPTNVIGVVLEAAGAIGTGGAGGLKVNVGDGVKIDTNALTLNLATDPALEYSSGALRVKVRASYGLTRDSNGLYVALATNPGLEFSSGALRVKLKSGMTAMTRDTDGIYIADAIAGDGLTINATTKVMAVGAGDGIDVDANSVAVDVTDIIDGSSAYGLTESSNNIRIALATNSGLTFNTGLAMGTPSALSVSSSSHVTSSTHAHAVTTSSDVGTSPAAAILASNASGQLTLAQLTLRGNLVFAGGDRSVTASNKLTLAPSGDLLLDPTGLVLLPTAQEVKTETFSDLVTGIAGMRMWDRGSNYRQMTIGAIKADEMFVRVFVADEVRIDRGEEYWSKSYGVVETDFVLPADEATVDVWFENSPGLAAANLFSTGDWLLARTIDWDSSLTIQKIWFQVVSLLTAGSVDGYKQQWQIRRKSGGTTGQVVKAGNTLLDAGQVGQGWIHLSALEQDGGPFIQIGEYTSVSSDVPQFTNYVRIGNLNGTVDYATDTWGQAAGDDLGTTPSAGFSGYAVDATNGLRLFNTEISMYDSGTLVALLDQADGLAFRSDSDWLTNDNRAIYWRASLPSGTVRGAVQHYGSVMRVSSQGADSSFLSMLASGSTIQEIFMATEDASYPDGYINLGAQGQINLDANLGVLVGSPATGTAPASKLHIYEDSTQVGANAGVTIEQDGTGDALLQWLLTGGQRWVMGIDNSVSGDPLVISASGDLSTSPLFSMTAGGVLSLSNTLAATTITPYSGSSQIVDVSGTAYANDNRNGLWIRNSTPGAGSGNLGGAVILSGPNGSTGANRGAAIYAYQASSDSDNVGLRFAVHDNTSSSDRIVMLQITNTGLNFGSSFSVSPAYGGGNDIPSGALFFTTTDDMTFAPSFSTPGTNTFVLAGYGNSYWNSMLEYANSATSAIPTLLLNKNGGISNFGGRVGIGGAPEFDDQLTVKGIIAARPTSGNADLKLLGSGGSGVSYAVFSDTSGNFGVYDGTSFATRLLINSSGRIGVGGETSPGAWIDLSADVGGVPLVRPTNYGANQYHMLGRTARGTKASPTQALNGTPLMALGGWGYTSSGWAGDASADITFRATESFTSSARGAKQNFYVTKNGTNILSLAMELGDDRQLFAPGVYAHATGSGANVNVDASGWLRLSTSSERYKTDIRPMPSLSGLFDQLVPVLYKPAAGVGGGDRDYPGLIAERVVEAGGGDFVTFDDEGRAQAIMYDRLVVLTIAEVQALKGRIADLERKLA